MNNISKLYKEKAYLEEYLELLREEPILEADRQLVLTMERDLEQVNIRIKSCMN